MRYFVQFSYFGQAYHGWQNQPNAISVQQVLEDAFSTLLRASVALTGAGRTDAGVHARQMFAHFDADQLLDGRELAYRLNSYLPADIAVQRIFEVPEKAHARFDALSRTYTYWIVGRKDPFYRDTAHYVRHPLDLAGMNDAARLLLKHRDFECFSKSHTDVKTYHCKLNHAIWEQKGDVLVFTVTADRFLRNMVRAVVGTLLQVGTGQWDVAHVNTVLKSRDRSMAGPSVPAKGLYLTEIRYPESIVKTHG